MSCKQAIGVAEAMKEKYGDALEVEIYTTDSPQALLHNFRSSTNVLFNGKMISVDIGVNKEKMDQFLAENM